MERKCFIHNDRYRNEVEKSRLLINISREKLEEERSFKLVSSSIFLWVVYYHLENYGALNEPIIPIKNIMIS